MNWFTVPPVPTETNMGEPRRARQSARYDRRHRLRHSATLLIGTFQTCRGDLTMSSVDGSRVARDKLTQWHWSGAVFCPAY
jgi:hypothetical protein